MVFERKIEMTASFKASSELILLDFFKKYFKGSDKDAENFSKDMAKVASVFVEEIKLNADKIEKQAIKNVRGELATKDFVRAEISSLRTELKQDIAEVRTEISDVRGEIKLQKREMRLLAFGLAILIIVFQPLLAELILGIFK